MSPQIESEQKAIPWLRIGAEGGAIVISILLAFSIDAGWDSRQELVEERAHLAALHSEFVIARDMIRTEAAQIQRAADATRLLIALEPEKAMAADPDSLAGLFVRLMSVGRANLPSGALDALMASGDLRLVRDRDLASKLASWPSLLAEAHENAGWLVEHREREFAPFLNQYVGGLWTAGKSGLLDGYPSTRFPPRTNQLFSDPLLEGHLSSIAVRLALMLNRYGALAEAVDATTASIEELLGR